MGIRPVGTVIYGVELDTDEIETMNQMASRRQIMYKWISNMVSEDIAMSKMSLKDRADFKVFNNAHVFLKRFSNGHVKKPYKPFWSGNEKLQRKVRKDIELETENYLAEIQKGMSEHDKEQFGLEWNPEKFWIPVSDVDDDERIPTTILGCVYHEDYCNDIFYSLFPILNVSEVHSVKVMEVPGTLPWETGTTKYKDKYVTVNPENLIPLWRNLPKEQQEEIFKLLEPHKNKKQYEIIKKELWDKYHGEFPPYRTYPHEGWYGSHMYFYEVDLLYEIVCDMCNLKYDQLRLRKYLVFWWR